VISHYVESFFEKKNKQMKKKYKQTAKQINAVIFRRMIIKPLFLDGV